ncbi:hypothetical protein ACKAV7_014442 [Fusarium commune]
MQLKRGEVQARQHQYHAKTPAPRIATKVAILGAGVAGITAAQTLHNASIHDFIILEHNDYVGGRMKHTTFGESSDGTTLTVELGANWIEGLQNPSGEINPIWRLAQKHKVKNTYSNDSAIITYDETGASDYTELIDLFDEKFEIASQEAGYIFTENLQDTSTRAGLSLAGWKPKRDMKMAAADWWGWDFETAYSPEESGFVYGVAGNNATFKHFSDETNLVIDQRGYNAWLIGEANEFLKKNDPRLRLKTTVKKIEYTTKGVKIDTNNGCVEADYAICTFSVGVLQNNAVDFKPTLPRWKRQAIEQFQMGTYTKIFMQFNETFWPEDTQYFLYADPEQRGYYPLFQSLSTPGFLPGSNILFGTVVQQQAYEVEQQSDEKTKKEIMEVLRSMFPHKHIPEPTAFMYPRWSMEEWSYGSYSNWPVGMTLEKHQNLRANVDRLWFAGEANSAEFFGYLQGAYFEGQEIGERIARILKGEESEQSQQMKRFVRVLEPSPYDTRLSLELRHGYIEDAIYSALSYVWGDTSEQDYILVNRVLCRIRRNLYQALTQLRSNSVVGWLWFDSLCIQQKNLDEKSYQVGLMGVIFSNAACVYSWLGEGTPSIDIAMDFCVRIGLQATMVDIDQRSDIELYVFLQELFSRQQDPSKSRVEDTGLISAGPDLAAFFLGLLQDPGLMAQESGANQLFQGLRDMKNQQYWKRIWINQEVALAKEAVILRGGKSESLGLIENRLRSLEFCSHCIEANYHLSMREVFTAATRAMYECDSDGLEVDLCTPSGGNQDVSPSWVIDWRKVGPESCQTKPINRDRRWPDYYATGELDVPIAVFLDGDNQYGILRRYGYYVDAKTEA